MEQVTPAREESGRRLRRVVALRWFSVAAELALVLSARQWLGSSGALEPVLAICAAQLGLNLASVAFGPRAAPASDGQLLAQLLFDVAALTGIAYLSGGSTNPIVGLYLLWIAAGAAMLRPRLAGALAAVCVACYSLVNFFHADVHIHDHEKALQGHLIGMWAIFVFSAATIPWSVLRLTAEVRQRDAELARAREAALRGERVVALGNLAAGAAHELGTPLATMSVLAGEILRDRQTPAALYPDLQLLQAQVVECKRIITQLAARAGTARAEGIAPAAVDDWLEALLGRWRLQRPAVEPAVRLAGPRPGPSVAFDATLAQALLNLFNNAADASPEQVLVEANWDEAELDVRVLDRGRGIPAELLANLGHEAVSTRDDGMGMGVVLAKAAIERCGGRLAFGAREGGGTVARAHLPLAGLTAARAGAAPELAAGSAAS